VHQHDFCGLYAAGTQVAATQNSKGQAHWFSRDSFFVDYSLYAGERAVKGIHSGQSWNPLDFSQKLKVTLTELEIMKRPTSKIPPGKHRVFLQPGAVAELAQFLAWYGFSHKKFAMGAGLFMDLGHGKRNLSPQISFRENFDLGVTPVFNSHGEVSDPTVALIENGRYVQWLISSQSAKEFNLKSNAANEGEIPRSLEILPGTLKSENVLKEMGTGIYLANLHYVNASDQKQARLTGMTRFAALRVENGELIGPIENLRFDESLYEAWGSKLVALTHQSELIPEVSTYGARALGGYKLPGMLIEDFSFTL
jgi:predicted Zn-dependent protease